MEFPILVRWHLYIESGTCSYHFYPSDSLQNVALEKPAFQQSNYSDLTSAINAVDGNSSTFAKSANQTAPGWYVDLGEFMLVEYLQITHHETQRELFFQNRNDLYNAVPL